MQTYWIQGVGVRPMHTGIGTDTLNSGRGELHVEERERVKIAKALGYTTHT
jgi:hypothetical protein